MRYYFLMRRWLVFFLIALLPVRLWASGAMSLQVVVGQEAATAAVHASMDLDASGHGAGCPLHSDPKPETDNSGVDECKVCELCAPLIEAPLVSPVASALLTRGTVPFTSTPAPSAPPESAFKPPRLLTLLT